MSLGRVYIVGAGPGALDLLTIRAYQLLTTAEVVLYDRLVNPEILELVAPSCLLIDAGKRLGESSAARQETVHLLLTEYARMGKKVVRLKGGDPFVFGRGGEEILALAKQGITAEVVPGISASVAVPSSAGIPVTMRGVASSFGVFTGHPADGVRGDGIDWQAAARVDTAVFLMGVGRLAHIVSSLLAHGRANTTPVAIVESGTLGKEHVTVGSLATIVAKAGNILPPATIIVGNVVAVRAQVTQLLESAMLLPHHAESPDLNKVVA